MSDPDGFSVVESPTAETDAENIVAGVRVLTLIAYGECASGTRNGTGTERKDTIAVGERAIAVDGGIGGHDQRIREGSHGARAGAKHVATGENERARAAAGR